jgi:hypothetical protein
MLAAFKRQMSKDREEYENVWTSSSAKLKTSSESGAKLRTSEIRQISASTMGKNWMLVDTGYIRA